VRAERPARRPCAVPPGARDDAYLVRNHLPDHAV